MAVYLGQTKISSSGLLESEVHQQKTVSPTTSTQVVTPDSGYNSLSQVTVNGVTAAIDPNIQAGNIKSGVQILGVTGDYDPTPDLGTLNVTPSTSAQTLTPSGNVDGWDEVNVAAVDHSIDPNIVAGNIRENVTILGVVGSLSPGGGGTINPPPTLTVDYLWFQAQEAGSTLGFYTYNTSSYNVQFEISTDGTNWTSWTYTDLTNYKREFITITFQNAGDYVYIRGNNTRLSASNSSNGAYHRAHFTMTGKIKAGGSIMTLLDKTDASRSLANRGPVFWGLFQGCGSLITPPKLPATTLANYCYAYMFYECGNLISVPNLPATTMMNYCYQYMFYGCTGLTTVPDNFLPATTLATACYQYMFYGCTRLTNMPNLQATTLVNYCYRYMFYMCKSLKVAKSLPATTSTSYCYNSMFYMCESLETVTSIALNPGASGAMASMFYGCTNLHYIRVTSTSWNVSYTSEWVSLVPSSSSQYTLEFHKPSGTTINTGNVAGIPSGWTTVDE